MFSDLFSDFFTIFFTPVFAEVIGFAIQTASLWAPVVLGIVAWKIWVAYVRADFLSQQEYVLLEIKLPKEIRRSPLATEIVLGSVHQTGGEGNWFDRYIKGKFRPTFSLELISIEGNIHFFIWARKGFRGMIESYIYSQYPTVEILEVPDYTRMVPPFDPHNKEFGIFGGELGLVKDDVYPIKTYIDYKLDKEGIKEEEKIDPLATVLEFLGSLGKGEQIWVQILVRAHSKKKFNTKKKGTGILFGEVQDWEKEVDTEIEKIRENVAESSAKITKKIQGKLVKPGEEGPRPVVEVPMIKEKGDIINALERSKSKPAFEVGIRLVYLAFGKDTFDPSRITPLLGLLKPFGSNTLNGFKPVWITSFDFPWQDLKNMRVNARKKMLLDAYIKRSYFHPPYMRKWFILTAEELATIFHFPGSVADIPTLSRIESKKVEPPSNLPV